MCTGLGISAVPLGIFFCIRTGFSGWFAVQNQQVKGARLDAAQVNRRGPASPLTC